MNRVHLFLAALAVLALAACQAPVVSVPTAVTLEAPTPAATHTPGSATHAPSATAVSPTAPVGQTATPSSPAPSAAPTSSQQTVPPFRRVLALQEPPLEGEDVQLVQQRLADLGYSQVGPADGIFGPATEAAVRAFQRQQGLEVDSIVGPQPGPPFSAPTPPARYTLLSLWGQTGCLAPPAPRAGWRHRRLRACLSAASSIRLSARLLQPAQSRSRSRSSAGTHSLSS